mgnify:CR=1 FL=1
MLDFSEIQIEKILNQYKNKKIKERKNIAYVVESVQKLIIF